MLSTLVVLQERLAEQQQQTAAAQADLKALQGSHSGLKSDHASALATQQLTEQRLEAAAAELRALQVEHTGSKAWLLCVHTSSLQARACRSICSSPVPSLCNLSQHSLSVAHSVHLPYIPSTAVMHVPHINIASAISIDPLHQTVAASMHMQPIKIVAGMTVLLTS